ncbi:retrotransposon protein, putative, ty1-copia subclass [Tanacetum coccineum]
MTEEWQANLTPHQVERAKELLGLIPADVCGPFKITSRQGWEERESGGEQATSSLSTDELSRYGSVYLLKHKLTVFETSSQEFLDHVRDHRIIAHRTHPYTPQHIVVSEEEKQTPYWICSIYDEFFQTTLPIVLMGFCSWTVHAHSQYGHLFIAIADTLYQADKLDQVFKCIFIGYPKETMGYSFYYPPENKVLVARNAEFLENSLINQEASGSLEDLEIIQEEDTIFYRHSLNHEEMILEIKSAKQSIFAISSAEAEYIAAFDASKEAVWVRKFISGLGVVPTIEKPINMYCDNTGAIA